MEVVFRAKTMKQDFKEEREGLKKIGNTWYAIGKEQPCSYGCFRQIITEDNEPYLCAIITEDNEPYLCDYSTRSINFEDMIDSEGSKIFASLSEDGKGGDYFTWDEEIFIVWFCKQSLTINATNRDNFDSNCHDVLQEWYCNTYKGYDLKIVGVEE